ncbi:MAG: HIT family protein [Nanoarchaeota archaeon]|nr:HIT family protein [Nanoarchaeota archaeon]
MKACIFCDFISNHKNSHDNHIKGPKEKYPVVPIFQDSFVYSFLSIPDNNNETHLLVVPKKHYEFIEDMPKELLIKLISKVADFAGKLRKKYSSCHILLNNGKNADQYIPHVHFHLIPKDNNKKLPWTNLSVEEFIKISNKLISR